MNPIQRKDILDYATYDDQRDAIRARILEIKGPRRVHVGQHLTFLFENTDTLRYQVQEMVRSERMVREADIQFELDTYNELLGGPGELSCTLLIEIEDKDERAKLLSQWLELPERLYVLLEDGSRVYASFDAGQRGKDRVSSVQYLKFNTHGAVPVAVGSDLPALSVQSQLTEQQRQALRQDLA